MLPPKHLSGAKKRAKRKRESQFIESQRGALDKFFRASSSVDVNNNNQRQAFRQKNNHRQEPDHGQDDDPNSNAHLEVNESKYLTSVHFFCTGK